MIRFWDRATAAPVPSGFAIHLDGKPMRLPGGPVLVACSAALAAALAEEWGAAGGARGGMVTAADTPLTRLAGTAWRIASDPAPTIDALARYAEADLLCYRADRPDALARAQDAAWQPWLDWAETAFGARLTVARGLMPIAQPADALARLRAALAMSSPDDLAGLGIAVPALGSLVLGLALRDFRLDAAAAHAAATLDERHQAEAWGEDAEAAARRRAVAADIALAVRYIALARAP